MILLSFDPSYNATGWALFEVNGKKSKVITGGCVETSRNKDNPVTFDDIYRTQKIALEVSFLLDLHKPDVVCTEIPLGSQSASAAKALGIAKGIIVSICTLKQVCTYYINPLEVKLKVCGKRNAEKFEIIGAVEKKYKNVKKFGERLTRNGTFTKKHEAVCDAIAVAMAAFFSNGKHSEIGCKNCQTSGNVA